MKRIAVILVDWNGVEVTRECLRSLNQLNPSADYVHKVILVDNASNDPIKKHLEIDFPDVIYFRNEQNLDLQVAIIPVWSLPLMKAMIIFCC
jgi:GT2 family glycosyltransferase